jgi:hypothetical protein
MSDEQKPSESHAPSLSKEDWLEMIGQESAAPPPVERKASGVPSVPFEKIMRHLVLEPSQSVAAAYDITPLARAFGLAGQFLVTRESWIAWITFPGEKVDSRCIALRITRLCASIVRGMLLTLQSGKFSAWLTVPARVQRKGAVTEGYVYVALSMKSGIPLRVCMTEDEMKKVDAGG